MRAKYSLHLVKNHGAPNAGHWEHCFIESVGWYG